MGHFLGVDWAQNPYAPLQASQLQFLFVDGQRRASAQEASVGQGP